MIAWLHPKPATGSTTGIPLAYGEPCLNGAQLQESQLLFSGEGVDDCRINSNVINMEARGNSESPGVSWYIFHPPKQDFGAAKQF